MIGESGGEEAGEYIGEDGVETGLGLCLGDGVLGGGGSLNKKDFVELVFAGDIFPFFFDVPGIFGDFFGDGFLDGGGFDGIFIGLGIDIDKDDTGGGLGFMSSLNNGE